MMAKAYLNNSINVEAICQWHKENIKMLRQSNANFYCVASLKEFSFFFKKKEFSWEHTYF